MATGGGAPKAGGFGGPDAADAGNGGGPTAGGLGGIGGGVAAAAAGLGDGADPELRDASLEASIDIMSPPPPPPPIAAGLGASSFLPTMGDDLSTVTTFFSAFLPKP